VKIAAKVPKLDRLRKWARVLGQVIYGMTIYDMVRELKKARASLEHLFILMVFGDLLGVPILPPYYSLRLRSMLREKDFTDLLDQELG
jgi:hypothetical protein